MSRLDSKQLARKVIQGDQRALARLISQVENREPGWREGMKILYPETGNALVIGITGSPGAGKSSLTNHLAAKFADRGHKVGIVAVDPSSPFSGGALLGDRFRMRDVALSQNVYIRSMATRGSLGGLCQGARDVTRILDAAGHDLILVETVGVGQDEIEIVKTADLVAVICTPGQGDGIQALKAGVMEIADIYVVNKADLDGTDEVVADIGGMLALAGNSEATENLIFKTDAQTGAGVRELADALEKRFSKTNRMTLRSPEHLGNEVLSIIDQTTSRRIREVLTTNGKLKRAVSRIRNREIDPYSAAEELLGTVAPPENTGHE